MRHDMGAPSIRVAVTVCVLSSVTALAACRSAGDTVTLVPVQMRRAGPQTKELSGGVALWGNGSLASEIVLPTGPVTLTVSARGANVAGEWPKLYVEVAGRVVASISVDSDRVVRDYTVQFESDHAGPQPVTVSLVNHVGVPGKPLQGRNLVVEKIVIRR